MLFPFQEAHLLDGVVLTNLGGDLLCHWAVLHLGEMLLVTDWAISTCGPSLQPCPSTRSKTSTRSNGMVVAQQADIQTAVCTSQTQMHRILPRLIVGQQGTMQGRDVRQEDAPLTPHMPPWAPISLSSEDVVVPHVPVEQVLALPADREPPATEKTRVPAAK